VAYKQKHDWLGCIYAVQLGQLSCVAINTPLVCGPPLKRPHKRITRCYTSSGSRFIELTDRHIHNHRKTLLATIPSSLNDRCSMNANRWTWNVSYLLFSRVKNTAITLWRRRNSSGRQLFWICILFYMSFYFDILIDIDMHNASLLLYVSLFPLTMGELIGL